MIRNYSLKYNLDHHLLEDKSSTSSYQRIIFPGYVKLSTAFEAVPSRDAKADAAAAAKVPWFLVAGAISSPF